MKTWMVEVLSVGTWNGDTFSRADLHEIAANFDVLGNQLRVPLKFGHADGQTLLGQADGDPALGWVSRLEVRGDRLVATFSQVPVLVREAVQAGLYRHVSSEIAYQVTYRGRRIGKVLVGVALLGADLPAVSNLADLGAYLSARGLTTRRVYQFARADVSPDLQGRTMTRSESYAAPNGDAEIEAADRPVTAQEQRIGSLPEATPPVAGNQLNPSVTVALLSAELAERQAEVERLRRRALEGQDALRLADFRAQRQGFQDALDAWVRQGALPPQARDKALAAADAQRGRFVLDAAPPDVPGRAVEQQIPESERNGSGPELMFRTSLVKELLAAMARPGPLSRETATAAPLGELARQSSQPVAASLAREASKLAATGRFTLGQAQAHVLAQDPELAARWLAEINHTLPSGGA